MEWVYCDFTKNNNYKDLFNTENRIPMNIDNDDDKNKIQKSIIDSFFAIRESMKIIQMYEPGYIIGFSYLAECHKRAGDWCQVYKNYQNQVLTETEKNTIDKNSRLSLFNENLRLVLGDNSFLLLEVNYQYEVALQNYHKVIEMHTEGKAYKTKLKNLYMLEDDYNDNLTHFNIALERFRVNNGNIRCKIIDLQDIISSSHIYKYKNYATYDKDKSGI